MIVLDASAFLSFILQEESNILSQKVIEATIVEQVGIIVPPIFKIEVLNAVLMAFKRTRIDEAAVKDYIQLIADFPVDEDDSMSIDAIAKVAFEHGLTSYDASYLTLAIHYNLPIVTLDKAIQRISEKLSLPSIPKKT